MDHDQEKFYEDEQESQDQPAEATKNGDEPVDDMQFFIGLIKAIRETIEEGRNVPFSSTKKIVDAEKCFLILDDLDKNLPDAIQYGLQMYKERERIMGNAESAAMNRVTTAEMRANATLESAKKEADRLISDAEDESKSIISDAQFRADQLVSDDEIVKSAREEARILMSDTKIEISEMRLKLKHEALQVLTGVEDELSAAFNNIRRRRKELDDEAK